MSNNDIRNISNVKVSNDCFKSLKKLAIDKETSLQKVVQDILERTMSKRKSSDNIEEK